VLSSRRRESGIDVCELVGDGAKEGVECVADLVWLVSCISEGLDFTQMWFVRWDAVLVQFECSTRFARGLDAVLIQSMCFY